MQVIEERQEATITQCVLAYAKAEGVDLETLSSVIGLNNLDIGYLQCGKRKLAAEEYVMLCEFLEVSPSMFIERDRVLER